MGNLVSITHYLSKIPDYLSTGHKSLHTHMHNKIEASCECNNNTDASLVKETESHMITVIRSSPGCCR